MKKAKEKDGMRAEYDFSSGVRGKYAKKFSEGTNLVLLDPDVSKLFPDSKSVNDALRLLGKIAKQKEKKAG
jgi:hypothetical protein